jgi:REP element-mobilizing transposase RayT
LRPEEVFASLDRVLDFASAGPFFLRQPTIADMVVEAIQYDARVLAHYSLHAFVVMPNHVHFLATPSEALPDLTRSLKGITGKRANALLSRSSVPFWQAESSDRIVH